MRLLSKIAFSVAMMVASNGSQVNKTRIDRSQTPYRRYPTAQENQMTSLSNEERILLLEQSSASQDNTTKALDERMTRHVDDFIKQQGVEDAEVFQLESRLDVIYRFGAVIAFVLTISVPFFLWILSKAQSHNKSIADSIMQLLFDVQAIKITCKIRNEVEEEKKGVLECL